MARRTHLYGFTLLEFSIVLIIIGLVLGGVAAGKHFIKAAELRAVTTEAHHFIGATRRFIDKYKAIPGDMDNATTYWGAQHVTLADCKNAASSDMRTCDGNGNNHVGSKLLPHLAIGDRAIPDPDAESYETFRFWQHLKNAELISGSFSGVSGPSTIRNTIIGINSPRSDFSGGGYSVHYVGDWTQDNNFWGDRYGHIFVFGEQGNDVTTSPLLTTSEAYEIDLKIDDGLPGRGMVQAVRNPSEFNSSIFCLTSDIRNSAQYNTLEDRWRCTLIFKGGF